jgi:hypothetical protein
LQGPVRELEGPIRGGELIRRYINRGELNRGLIRRGELESLIDKKGSYINL